MQLVIKDQNKIEPRGGTELMRDRLMAAGLDWSKTDLIISAPRPGLDENKNRVLWLHDLPLQPGPHAALKDNGHLNYDAIVFVSHWQRNAFHARYQIPHDMTVVIPNGIEPLSPEPLYAEALQFYYASTPHRGLHLVPGIANALAEILGEREFQFHVCSSFRLYGIPEADAEYKTVFDALKRNPNVVYHGTMPNSFVRTLATCCDALVYPCTYEETSCLVAIEALAGGSNVITTDIGALPETVGRSGRLMPTLNPKAFAQAVVDVVGQDNEDLREDRSRHFNRAYDFVDVCVPLWQNLLASL